jgi:TniQ
MQRVSIDDPAWYTTFPHLVPPLPDEWLPGLLLRCDEVNHWESGTTLALLQQLSPRGIDWRIRMHRYIYIPPYLLNLDYLAQLLAIPISAVLATTYYFERVQLYHNGKNPERLYPPFSFHLCPECLAESRLLRRNLILPHITHCPRHQLALLDTCQCGSSLFLFHRQSWPFTCYTCGVNWADLPRTEASPERVALENDFMLWYEFFFSKGTLLSVSLERKLLNKTSSERKVSLFQSEIETVSYYCDELAVLGFFIAMLAMRNLSPSDLIDYDESITSDLG